MISFGITEEQEMVRDAMRDFAEKVIRPIARECDEASAIPDSFLDEVWQLGLTSTQIPESYGGGGEERSPITNAIVLEELAFGDTTLAIAALAPSLFANALVDQGSEAQKQALLPLFTGERYHVASLAVLEPTAVFDATQPRTVAEPKGDDKFVVSGVKSFVPMGDRASHFLVVARNNGGLDAFIVARDAEGLTISESEKNLGLRALPTHTIEFERVEAERLGGAAGSDVRRLLDNSRAAICAALTGMSRAVLEFCIPYVKDRVAFGQPIGQKQSIAFRLAEMHSEIESMRWLGWKAATKLESGTDVTRAAHLARIYAAEHAMWIADNGVQVLGGHGFIREHPVEMWYRNARTLSVLEGTLAL